MIQKIVYSSIFPYANVPKKFEGMNVGGHYTGDRLKEGSSISERDVAERIYKEGIDKIVRDALGLHDRTPNLSFSGTHMHHSYSIDNYILVENDGTPTQSVVSSLTTQHQYNLEVRKQYLKDKSSKMTELNADMVAGTLQLIISYKDPNKAVKNLLKTLYSLQAKEEGIVKIDSKNLIIEPIFLDKDGISLLVSTYLMFHR